MLLEKQYQTLLANNFNGYSMQNTNFNIQTLEAIFSENASVPVKVTVAGLRDIPIEFFSGDSNLIWSDSLAFYVYVTTSNVLANRASIKLLEGIQLLKVEEQGFSSIVHSYLDYGQFIDLDLAFTKVEFTLA